MLVIRLLPVFLCCSLVAAAHAAGLLPLHASGTRLVDDQDRPVVLRGCNVGNWLVLEMWMAQWRGAPDQYEAERILTERFGTQQKDAWLDQYREGFMQDRDWELIKSFGFNAVRLPVHYNLVLEDQAPFALRKDAFKWIDRALDMAERHGVYVIIDLHAAPGSQSVDHNSGRSGFNRLWSEEQYQQAFERFWRETATHYAGRSVVAGYDMLNEPYGNYRDSMAKPMLALAEKAYHAIRESDGNHVIYLPATLSPGLSMYDNDTVRGWKQVGLTEHHYPGLFGGEGSVEAISRYLYRSLPSLQRLVWQQNRPLLIGEFNVVLHNNGGVYATRLQYDEYARYGWAATLWSYKILKPQAGAGDDNWYLVTNASPLPAVDLRKSTKEELDRYFADVATVPLVRDEHLLKALTSAQPLLTIEKPAALPERTPADNTPAPWESRDVSVGRAGATVFAAAEIQITAAGRDIFGNSDSFRFTSRSATHPFRLTATLAELVDSDRYAKAGLMLRITDSPDSPQATIHAFPDGSIAFCYREKVGGPTKEAKAHVGLMPVQLRLESDGRNVTGYYMAEDGKWEMIHQLLLPLTPDARVGLAVASHSDQTLTRACFRDVDYKEGGALP